jgi:hypothetical protein
VDGDKLAQHPAQDQDSVRRQLRPVFWAQSIVWSSVHLPSH